LPATWTVDKDAPPVIKEWFKAQRAKGLPCCDIADGHETSAEKRQDGHYWVPIEGRWRGAPDLPSRERVDERRLVDHPPARRVAPALVLTLLEGAVAQVLLLVDHVAEIVELLHPRQSTSPVLTEAPICPRYARLTSQKMPLNPLK
jgi:hypothetical protein